MTPKLYEPWLSQRRDPSKCNAKVYDKYRMDVVGHQCTRLAVIFLGDCAHIGYCKTHAKRYQQEEP